MVSPGEFVDGAELEGRRLVATLIGGVVTAWFAGYWYFVESLASLAQRFVVAPITRFASLLELSLGIPTSMIAESWAVAASWFEGPLSALGPLAYPLAMIITGVVLWILHMGIRRIGVIG